MKPFKVTLTGPNYGVTELIMADSIEEAKEKAEASKRHLEIADVVELSE